MGERSGPDCEQCHEREAYAGQQSQVSATATPIYEFSRGQLGEYSFGFIEEARDQFVREAVVVAAF